MRSKEKIRQEAQETLKSLNNTRRSSVTQLLHDRLFDSDLWRNANSIGVTMSQDIEWDTYPIINRAWREKKTISVPKATHKTRQMTFYAITSFDQLEEGYIGIQEPIEEKATKIKKQEIDLLIVPGVAFTKAGYRIGFGGGFYDRFLADYTGETVSLIATEQLYNNLPHDEYDQPVNYIITDQGLIHCDKNRKES